MLGGSPGRNMVNPVERNLPTQWNITTGKNIKWSVQLGGQAYGGPVVAGGKIYIGTNNNTPRNPRHKGDKGILLCLRESDGKFLWQAVHDKLPFFSNDLAEQGIASTPSVDGNRVYYVSNRCELICADTEGLANGNQGVQDEQYQDATDADILWRLDMMQELGVNPHYLAVSSPLVVGDLVYVVTGHGHDETHSNVPNPQAPSFLAVDKRTGKVVWQDNSPGKNILHAQWSSPTYAEINGQPQILFPGGDGWLRAFEPKTGKLLWKFDGNPKKAVFKHGGKGDRNEFIATAVVHDGKVYIANGQDVEHNDGVGHLWCIDPSKASPTNTDLSPVNDNFDPKAPENRRSGLVWHLGGKNAQGEILFARTISLCAVHDGLCFVSDLAGRVYCIDAATGQPVWQYDRESQIWGSPYWADGKIYVGNEEGDMLILAASRTCRLIAKHDMGQSFYGYGMAVAANGTLYVKTKWHLYAIAQP